MNPAHARPWREALEELWRRKLRTGLTLLGLIFGVGAIVAMQGVGEGSRLEALAPGGGPGPAQPDRARQIAQDRRAEGVRLRSLGLTRADARAALEVVPGAERFAAEKEIKTHSVLQRRRRRRCDRRAVSRRPYFALASLQVASGRA
jgi:putative ABC transport system permease protein